MLLQAWHASRSRWPSCSRHSSWDFLASGRTCAHATIYCATPRHATPRHAILLLAYHTTPHCATRCHTVPHHACLASPCHALACHTSARHTAPRHATPRRATRCVASRYHRHQQRLRPAVESCVAPRLPNAGYGLLSSVQREQLHRVFLRTRAGRALERSVLQHAKAELGIAACTSFLPCHTPSYMRTMHTLGQVRH